MGMVLHLKINNDLFKNLTIKLYTIFCNLYNFLLKIFKFIYIFLIYLILNSINDPFIKFFD